MGNLKIVKYVQHPVAGRRLVLQWTHVTQVTYDFVLITCFAIPFIAFVVFACHERAARGATSLSLADSLVVAPLSFPMIVETRPTPKVSVARVAGDSDAFEPARGARHPVAVCEVADVRDVTATSFVARLAGVPSRHRPVTLVITW